MNRNSPVEILSILKSNAANAVDDDVGRVWLQPSLRKSEVRGRKTDTIRGLYDA